MPKLRETVNPSYCDLGPSCLAKIAGEKAQAIQEQYDLGILTAREYLFQMGAVFNTAVLDMEGK